MKQTLITLTLLAACATGFAEKVTFTAGNSAGSLFSERYLPLDFTASATCAVTAVRKVEKDRWCLVLTAAKDAKNAAYPVTYEYYITVGDKIRMRKVGGTANALAECTLTVTRVTWNEVEFDAE